MLRPFELGNFGVFVGNFERAVCFAQLVMEPTPFETDADRLEALRSSIERFETAPDGILQSAPQDIYLTYPVIRQIESFAALRKRDEGTLGFYMELATHARLLRQAMMDDLSQHVFLSIDGRNRELYEQKEPPFGKEVADRFPDANKDIECACRCVAVSEWTASVFHLMRVLEHGLRLLATRFNVGFATDSWHKVLTGIEDGIGALRQKSGLTQQDRDAITFYSDAASQFRHVKDAWRNHVSHARAHYDEKDTAKVLEHVKALMQHLATSP